jgi:hypothetical protein
MIKNFDKLPTVLQFLISLALAIPLVAGIVVIVMALAEPDTSSFVASIFLWTGVTMIYLSAKNNGGVKKVWLMLLALSGMAGVNTLGSLRRLGIEDISPVMLTRMFSAVMVFTGVSITVSFGLKYYRAKRLQRHGFIEHETKIIIPDNRKRRTDAEI